VSEASPLQLAAVCQMPCLSNPAAFLQCEHLQCPAMKTRPSLGLGGGVLEPGGLPTFGVLELILFLGFLESLEI
jgi:hypothetical protein